MIFFLEVLSAVPGKLGAASLTTLTFSAAHGLVAGDRIVLQQSAIMVNGQFPLADSVGELDIARLSGIDVRD